MHSFQSFVKKYRERIFVFLVILALFAYSLPTLTTKPRVSYDEGFFVEEAYNFEQYGKLDIIVAPNTFSELPHIVNSSGFPGTLPLALFFKLFGFGLAQARIYALLWMSVFLTASYIFARRFFGVFSAVSTVLLLLSFPPFHENGRMAMGDIPGFTLLLFGLLSLKRSSFQSGVLLGLSAISRPSVYVGGLIATCISELVAKGRKSTKHLVLIVAGVIPSIVISLLLYLPESFTKVFWQKTVLFVKAPTFGVNSSPGQNLVNNLISFFTTQTLFYFLLLFLIIVIAFFVKGRREWNRKLLWFSVIYGSFVMLYFLRSPGWFKYLLPFQFLVFFYLPTSIRYLVEWMWSRFQNHFRFLKIDFRRITYAVVGILVLVQFIQLFYFADIFKSNDVEETMAYLSAEITPTTTVAFIHGSLEPLAVPIGQRYNFNVINESFFIGQNPLRLNPLPTYIVKPEGIESFSAQFQGVYAEKLESEYVMVRQIGRSLVYKKK